MYHMRIAVIYQKEPAPAVNGIVKPMKSGGYSDSGADIAVSLKKQGVHLITPVSNPNIDNDLDWVFPDTADGIQQAVDAGADTIWMNTVLYKNHPILRFTDKNIFVIGQLPDSVELFDDKIKTNALLEQNGLRIPKNRLVKLEDLPGINLDMLLPVVVKPIRGRGSQGVSLVHSYDELIQTLRKMLMSGDYGDTVYIEEFLSGEEITISVLPPGKYKIANAEEVKSGHWALPAVKRFNHQNGIAPYNGVVAVTKNSIVMTDEELQSTQVQTARKMCEDAAALVGAKALIRIDCRADANGDYALFDLNMKPNMTGASRPHRLEEDSLTAIAARKIGWTFYDLVMNIAGQRWNLSDLNRGPD